MTIHEWCRPAFVCLYGRLCACIAVATLCQPASTHAQASIPPLPDTTGWGVHVLAVARDAHGAIWVGTYGHGIYRLPAGATAWQQIRHDTTETSISWDFVQALGFG